MQETSIFKFKNLDNFPCDSTVILLSHNYDTAIHPKPFSPYNHKKSLTPREGMREISWLCWRLIPGAVEQIVDQRGGIGDVNPALQVAVGVLHVEASGVAIE